MIINLIIRINLSIEYKIIQVLILQNIIKWLTLNSQYMILTIINLNIIILYIF